jgi:hypothetical protein
VSSAAATAQALLSGAGAEIDPAKIENEKRRECGDLVVARIT